MAKDCGDGADKKGSLPEKAKFFRYDRRPRAVLLTILLIFQTPFLLFLFSGYRGFWFPFLVLVYLTILGVTRWKYINYIVKFGQSSDDLELRRYQEAPWYVIFIPFTFLALAPMGKMIESARTIDSTVILCYFTFAVFGALGVTELIRRTRI